MEDYQKNHYLISYMNIEHEHILKFEKRKKEKASAATCSHDTFLTLLDYTCNCFALDPKCQNFPFNWSNITSVGRDQKLLQTKEKAFFLARSRVVVIMATEIFIGG